MKYFFKITFYFTTIFFVCNVFAKNIEQTNDENISRPVLVELFTSASCAACPPADQYVSTLKDNPNLLVLSYHVDYWDTNDWLDKYSLQDASDRQRWYSQIKGFLVYTPQIIVEGEKDVYGFKVKEGNLLINANQKLKRVNTIIKLDRDIEKKKAVIQFNNIEDSLKTLVLISYTPNITQKIGAGENGGKTISYTNVVRSIRYINLQKNNGFDFDLVKSEFNADNKLVAILQKGDGSIAGLSISKN